MRKETPALLGLHHLLIEVPAIDATATLITRVFGAERQIALDHYDDAGELVAMIFTVPGIDVPVQIRHYTGGAREQVVGLSVADLGEWLAHLDALDVPHGAVERRMSGHTVDITTGSGLRIRLYESYGERD